MLLIREKDKETLLHIFAAINFPIEVWGLWQQGKRHRTRRQRFGPRGPQFRP